MRVGFLFNRNRDEIMREWPWGNAPTDLLYGLLHLADFGFEARVHRGESGGWLTHLVSVASHRIFAGLTGIGFNLEQALRIRKWTAELDLLFCTADSCGLPVLLLKSLGLIDVPVVYASVGLANSLELRGSGRAIRPLVGRLLENADRIVCYGAAEPHKVSSMLRAGAPSVEFMPFGVDAEFFDPAKAEAKTSHDVVLSYGKDTFRDFPLLVKATRDLPVRLKIVTSRGAFSAGEDTPNVSVEYDVGPVRLREAIREATVIAFPVKENDYTGATISLLDAMSMAKPVVVTSTAAVSSGYGLENEVNCLTVPPSSSAAMSIAVSRLVSSPELRCDLGSAARENVLSEYTAPDFARRLAGVFQQVGRQAARTGELTPSYAEDDPVVGRKAV